MFGIDQAIKNQISNISAAVNKVIETKPAEENCEINFSPIEDYVVISNFESSSSEGSYRLQITDGQEELRENFKNWNNDGSMIYSQNFGLLDTQHIKHQALNYVAVYKAAIKSSVSGEPEQVSLKYHNDEYIYSISAKEGDDFQKIAREVVADASYRSEKSTVVAGGFVNKAVEELGGQSSAFSTEDLSSNALGIYAAEELITKFRANINDPPKEEAEVNNLLLKKIEKINRAGEEISNQETDKFSEDINDWVLFQAGDLYYEENTGLTRESFGNDQSFVPVFSPDSNISEPDPKHTEFFEKMDQESKDRGGFVSGNGEGWHLVKEDNALLSPNHVVNNSIDIAETVVKTVAKTGFINTLVFNSLSSDD